MNMAQLEAREAQRVPDASLLDVHMKQVAEQFHILRAEQFHKTQRVVNAVQQIGFVTVERFIEQWHAVNGGARREFLERFGQPGESLRAWDAVAPAALH